MYRSWEGAEGESGSTTTGQEREKQSAVRAAGFSKTQGRRFGWEETYEMISASGGSWTEAGPGPCTAGVSDPRPWSSRKERTGPQEHPRKVGRGQDSGRNGPHGAGGQGQGGLSVPLVQ